ncbi:MAG TPA: hypothetical protein ENO20_00625 [Bacteroides sp.]|nr:hypothetical protein [Bacteroides sp.]
MIKRMLILAIVWCTIPLSLKGQPYTHAAGVRAGYSSGITYKGFLRYSMSAFQVEACYNRRGLNLSFQYLVHWEPFRSRRWLVYSGGGAFSGQWDEKLSAGLSVSGGIEYMMRDIPVNFGFDWKPMVNLFGNPGVDLLDFGISIRYRFSL